VVRCFIQAALEYSLVPGGGGDVEFFIFYFFWCPMAAEMRQRHGPESHATQKPRSRAPGPKNDPKPSFSKSGVRRAFYAADPSAADGAVIY
jgi:hypothetical protein